MTNDLKCPYCNFEDEPYSFPDLFYQDSKNTEEINMQYELLKELWDKGFNIVTCGNCGYVFIHKIQEHKE